MAAPPLTDEEIGFLRELTRRRVRFLVVGLAAAALQGVPAVTEDVDLWFRDLSDPGLKEALEKFGAAYVPPSLGNPPLLVGKAVALFDVVDSTHGLQDFDSEYRRALPIELGNARVRVLPLDRVVVSKKATNRPRDRMILPVLEDALRARGGAKKGR